MSSFLSENELVKIGFKNLGKNVLISKLSSIYQAEKIVIGNDVRIDDFCILSGNINLGNNIHIAAFSALFGGNIGIEMHDFSGLSSRVSVYAITDDYSGQFLTNPMVPLEYRNVISGKVIIKRHVIIGASSVVLPGVVLEEGSSFGSMSLINKSSLPWSVNVGIPAKFIKERNKDLLILEKKFLEKE